MICLLLDRPQHRQSNSQRPTSIKGVDLEKIGDHGTPLGFAAAKGLDEVVKLFLSHGANVEALDKAGQSPLLRAFQSGHASTVKILLQNGAKYLGQPAESLALWPANNQDLIVGLLVNDGADIESKNERGMTLLACAAGAGQLPMLVQLLDHKANIEARDKAGYTPLWHALMKSQASTFEMLLARGADVEVIDRQGDTPLFFAAKKGLMSVIEMLLNRGATIDIIDQQGNTPLFFAAKKGWISMLEMLLNRGANANVTDRHGDTPLLIAAKQDSISILEMLLKSGVNVDAIDQHGDTPLFFAAKKGSIPMIEMLLKFGAQVDTRNKETGQTPLWNAITCEQTSALQILINQNPMIEAKDCTGRTALSIAAGMPNSSALKILLQHGAVVDASDKNHRTPLWYAVAEGLEASVMALIEYGADVNRRDSDDTTPIMKAAESGHWSTLAKLWQFRADPSTYDKFGRTALLLAVGAGRDSVYSTDVLKIKRNLGGEVPGRHKDSSVFEADPPIVSRSQHPTEGRDSHGRTPLWWAITSGKTKMVEMLSKMVDEVEVLDKQCRPPLMSGSPDEVNGIKMVQLLLEHVSQFGPNGERLRSPEGISERAISYVQTFLEFNGIDTNRIGLWHSIKPGMHFPLLISNDPVRGYASRSTGEAMPLQILWIMGPIRD